MGLLDELLGSVLGGATGQGGFGQRQAQASAGGGMGGVMMALLPVVLSMLSNRGGGAMSRGAMPQGGGGLGDILGQVLGGGQSGGGMGGLGGLIEQMQRTGYGDQARSWVGTGQNMPIQPDALDQIFGQGGVEEIARRAGVTPREASEGMSELLPEVVNHMTPQGDLPDGDQLTQSVDDLRRRMGL
jgi:uncharacterized protein YidB (DUF937 family)